MFSIILPVYNGETHIKTAINSVIEQDYTDWELIIVNDGSTDKTLEICREFSLRSPKIKILDKENSGVSDSRNKGLEIASGDYVLFLDADDKFENNCLSKIADYIGRYDCDFSVFNFYVEIQKEIRQARAINKCQNITEKNEINDIIHFSLCFSQGDYRKWYGNLRTVWGKCYKNLFLKTNHIQFTEGLKIGEDMIFNLNCLVNASHVGLSNSFVYIYTENPSSVMHRRTWNGYEQGELYFNEAEKIVGKVTSEYALANLWLETAETDWMTIIEDHKTYNAKRKIYKELFSRPLYQRFSSEKVLKGKKYDIYMFAIRNRLPGLLMMIMYLKRVKNNRR